MKDLNKVKERISNIISREMQKINEEIEKLRHTQSSNMSVYGIGGPYRRYEKAISKRQELLSELEALQKAQGKSVGVCQVKCVSFYFGGDRFYLVTLLHDKLVKWQFFLDPLIVF